MDPILRWQEALENRPGNGPDFLGRVRNAGLDFGDRPLCTFARPLFITPEQVVQYARLMRSFHEAIRFTREMIEADGLSGGEDSLAIRLGLTRDALELASIPLRDPSASILARADTFCPDGHSWLLELNAESPAGMAYGDALTRVILSEEAYPEDMTLTPLWTAPAAVTAVIDAYTRVHGKSHRPCIAIVDLREVPTWSEFLLFKEQFEARGVHCIVCDPGELDFDGHRLTHNGTPIDVVYRRILVEDILAHPDRTEALLSAYRAQKITMVNSLRSALLHGKGLFALLHDPMVFDLLPRLAQEMVMNHIPWTGILSDSPGLGAPPNLKEIVRQNRERWVIKPLRGHGGSGVVIGSEVDQPAWDTALQEAQSHIVQRKVLCHQELFPDANKDMALESMRVSLDPYLIRGRLAGFLCRLSRDSLGNIHQGSSQVPVVIHGKAPLSHLPDLSN